MKRKEFAAGLVVGKFAPLHHGHELVIRQALESCEQVYVISYSKPELPGCELEKRERWLAELFPTTTRLVVTDELLAMRGLDVQMPANADDERLHRRFVGTLCRELLHCEVDAVFTSEDYGDGFAAELTRYFRETNPHTAQVRHVEVDRARGIVPVSGTALRESVHALAGYLSPVVYADFVERVCLLGGESSGKSSLALALAAKFQTVSVPEYGREFWVTKGGELMHDDMLHIAQVQVEREEAAARSARRYLFCDTSPLTTLFYAREYGEPDPELVRLAARPYTLAVLCAPDFPFVQDGTRRDETFRERQHRWYLEKLEAGGQPWILVTGSMVDRVGIVAAALERLTRGEC